MKKLSSCCSHFLIDRVWEIVCWDIDGGDVCCAIVDLTVNVINVGGGLVCVYC